jgi:Tfp pilus assembly protein PilF
MRGLIAACLLIMVTLCARPAQAQDRAAANTLFDEGRRLMEAGDLAAACAKFKASIAIASQLGVRLNLATCYEKRGLLASAWTEFRMAESQATKTADPRGTFAQEL